MDCSVLLATRNRAESLNRTLGSLAAQEAPGIEWEVRRKTLVAQRSERGGEVVYHFDIRLQDTPDGGAETVFFDV